MTSLEIISMKQTIKDYLNSCGAPKEISRMVVREVYEDLQREALEEALTEAKEREKDDGEDIR